MKRNLLVLLLVCLLTGMLCGCQENSDVAAEENADNAAEKTVAAWLEGDFTVTVREVIPDYVLDDTTPRCAVVTYFQGAPFVVHIGDRASELEIGELYTFTIKSEPIGWITESEVDKDIDYLEARAKYKPIEIESFRKAKEDELGCNGPNIRVVRQK